MNVGRPIRLVYHDEEGVFHMDSEAVSILERVKGPIGVISVCGPLQQGKSYLANQLLGRTSGFKVASITSFPGQCTEGLWLWSASSSSKTAADGTEYNILVMDTHGMDGREKDEDYLYIAAVLSSMLLYNQVGVINDSSFYCLSLFRKMANRDIAASELGDLSPTFVWVLRDFYKSLSGMTPSEYMESCLEPVDVPGHVEDDISGNKVRKAFKAVFPDRHCFTLVRPMIEENDLLFVEQIPMDRLRPKFKKGMDHVRSFLFEKTKPKRIGATVMTGPILVQITRYILDAFNNGTWPMITSILEKVGKTERPKALKSAFTAGTPPAANTRLRKRRLEQMMSSQKLAFMSNI